MNLCSSVGATASSTSLASDDSQQETTTACGGGGGGGSASSSSACAGGGGGGSAVALTTHCFGNLTTPSLHTSTSSLSHYHQNQGNSSNNNEMPPEIRPKVVTVKHPESNKPKPTMKKTKPIQADQDVIKALQKCRDEGIKRLDLSKSSITFIPPSVKDCVHLTELYLYSNKIGQLPQEIGFLVNLKTLALNENSLTSLPDSLQSCKQLKRFRVSNNQWLQKNKYLLST